MADRAKQIEGLLAEAKFNIEQAHEALADNCPTDAHSWNALAFDALLFVRELLGEDNPNGD